MFRIEANNYQSPFYPCALYMRNERCEYPSVMAYIYNHLLGNKKKNLGQFFDFYRKNMNFSELQDVYNKLAEQCKENFFKDRLSEAYKRTILVNFNNLEKEWPTVHTTEFNNDTINEILQKYHTKYITKLTKDEKDKHLKYFKIKKTLKFLLSQRYDINCFSGKSLDEILESLKLSDKEDPLWDRKKCEFMKFYNKLDSDKICLKKLDSLPSNLVENLRKEYISRASLGMPEKQTLNDYIKKRIENEKIKEMIRIFLNEKYADAKAKNTQLINEDWEHEFNDYAQKMLQDMDIEEKKKFLELYEKIEEHSQHHLQFLEKLQEQMTENIDDESVKSESVKSASTQSTTSSTEEEPKFETETQKKLLEQLQMELNSEPEVESKEIIRENHLLNPDFKQLITMDDKQYGSIGCYVYAKFLDWISPDLYYEIFTNPKDALKSEKYRKNLDNFKSLEDLKKLCDRKLDEKKVFLAQKALYSLYFNKDKWHLRDQLVQSGTDNIYVFINDPVLGVNAQGVGENKIGLTLENIRTLLAKSDTKNKIFDKIYKCGSNPVIKNWLKTKYDDLITTIKIFAKFFHISPINSKVVKYVIDNIYLPNVSIYLHCQKSIPSEEFISNMQDQFIGTKIDTKIILDIWKYVACLCFNIIKANKGGDIAQTIKNYQSRLDYGENKSRKLIKKALDNIACHIKNFQEHTPTGYYTCSAQIIGGMEIAPTFDLKAETEKDAMIKYLGKHTSTNRINFFAKNKCRKFR